MSNLLMAENLANKEAEIPIQDYQTPKPLLCPSEGHGQTHSAVPLNSVFGFGKHTLELGIPKDLCLVLCSPLVWRQLDFYIPQVQCPLAELERNVGQKSREVPPRIWVMVATPGVPPQYLFPMAT